MTTAMQKDIDAIVSQLVTHYKPEKIILFGSTARGDATEESDIDVFVVKDTSKPYYDRIREATRSLPPSRSIDMIVYTPQEFAKAVSERRLFIRHVLKYGKTLYETPIQSS